MTRGLVPEAHRQMPGGLGAVERGFTLIELIMVMVMLGVLAAVAGPKMFDLNIFNARGFHDQTLAYLRYAQKTAVAQRRTVCVNFGVNPSPTPNTITLAIAAAADTADCNSPGTLTVPLGGGSAVLSSKAGVTFSGTWPPVSFNFDALGQPISTGGTAQARQKIQVSGNSNFIYVETVTGYVHE